MADIVDKKTRSRMMSGIRGRDTKPELLIRKALHKRGFRYRTHVRDIPGRPDLVFPKYGAVVFVHGCFWHRHPSCALATVPSSNASFWKEKFDKTIERDARIMTQLRKAGWRIAIIWECVAEPKKAEAMANMIKSWLLSDRSELELGNSLRFFRSEKDC
jgi:DNA mismatch endonuclease (patch repair protein)